MKNIELDKTYWFEYHCLESDESCDAKLWKRTHAKVIKRYSPKETDIPLYDIEFDDKFVGTAFIDELLTDKKDFERPDYKPSKKTA